MHDFVIVILMALALWKTVDLIEELVPGLTRLHTLTTVIIGVAAAVAVDYSMFRGLHVALRQSWMGPALTGLAIAGCTSAWLALFHWFGSAEGEAPEVRHAHRGPRRIAA